MRKLLLAIALVLPLVGCTSDPNRIGSGNIVTGSIQNPVTPKMMYEVQSGLQFAVAGLVTYKRLCLSHTIDQSCREVVAKIQVYTIAAKPVLVSLRRYLKDNDQINAVEAYLALQDILTGINTTRRNAGV